MHSRQNLWAEELRVLFVNQFVQKIKQGALIERDWLKSQVDYQISESFDWHNKELLLFYVFIYFLIFVFVLINHL